MTDYLPEVYQRFSNRFPAVKEAFDALGAAEHEAGPLGEKERRLVKLGVAVGAESEGAVRSHASKLSGHKVICHLDRATEAGLGLGHQNLRINETTGTEVCKHKTSRPSGASGPTSFGRSRVA